MTWISKHQIIQKLCAAMPVLFCGLLFLVASSLLYYVYYVLQPNGNSSQHQRPITTSSWRIDKTTSDAFSGHAETSVETLLEETLALQDEVNAFEKEKKERTASMASEKELQRQLSATLNDKTKLLHEEQTKMQEQNQTLQLVGQLEKEIRILEANAALQRDFFDYMSVVFQTTPYPGVNTYTRYTVARLGMLPLDGIEPLKPQFGPVINDVLSFQYPLTVPACQDVTTANRSVFLAIISGAGNFEKRNVTRHLWPKHLKAEQDKGLMGVAGFAFILGKPDKNETQKQIEEESQMYGDIIQIEMVDTYRNLSLKVAALFNWLHIQNCSKVDFLFKVDDDVYVNVRNLVQFIQSQPRHDTNLKSLDIQLNIFTHTEATISFKKTADSGSLKQSLKMAGLLHWLHTNCAHMHFLLKVEDHVYVNVRNLANFATQYRPRFNDSIFGTSPSTFATKSKKSTHKEGLNSDLFYRLVFYEGAPVNSSHSYEEWPWSHYPPHLLDHAVLLANSTILPLLAAIQTTPRVVMDHLYYTGICREKAAIRIGNSSTNSSRDLRPTTGSAPVPSGSKLVLGVLATNLPDNPTPCYLRQFIALLMTSAETQMKSWHVATDDFYRNKTFCIVTAMNATSNATTNATTNATLYHNQLFTFHFTDPNI
ncbi:Uncharacterized protein APZ42_017163 [Daphnia magna]|uniref:Hexosyltransferase n=1 Tax=Daphnia magna TaxID=35525 RepID=A0A164ZP10_9CRUS|nr:Uncharacterized protein APZ42_017163 [Daphnia magna]